MKPTQESYTPTFAGTFVVEFAPGEFTSGLKAIEGFDAGQTMALLGRDRITKGPKAYTSVQCGRGKEDHIELNSDLVYINHSCEPNVAFDLSSADRTKWNLRALKRIEPGTFLTFFYPSTEWDMDQPFTCQCKTPTCLGMIQGAKYLSRKQLVAREFASPWILEEVDERDKNGKAVSRL
ncbi:hypothetical protein BDQ12DRAFT_681748 [Crucibulum laeve]|uniref:SET domain-containing protein n=1 Tax=Crucibulum laeve TaxID=68775 RepID=A0A5C3M4A6_9AGAR|nr:hypothetical protein BDQ12DRAFT_681748 [Crucibulum laeve]